MPVPTQFEVRSTDRHGLAIVAVTGEIDTGTAPQLAEVLNDLAERGRVVLVDLSDVEFIDLHGIGVLADAHRRQRELGGDLVLDSPRRAVSKVFRRIRLNEVITVFDRPREDPVTGGARQ